MTARTAALGPILLLGAVATLAGCGPSAPSGPAALDGLVVLAAGPDGTTLSGWNGEDAAGTAAAGTSKSQPAAPPTPIDGPKKDATWISAGRAGVLAATLADGSIATSDPVVVGESLAWRPLTLTPPDGVAAPGPLAFATWDPAGATLAALAGDITTGDGVSVVIIDPSKTVTRNVLTVQATVLAAPPAWIGKDRLAIVTGDTADPATTLVDTTTLKQTEGPGGARLIVTSADAERVATMAAQGAPVVVRETDGWLSGDGSSLASIDPPKGARTAIAFALDTTGQRLAVAWLRADGSVTLSVHAAASGWRSVATPTIAPATGAAVTWLR